MRYLFTLLIFILISPSFAKELKEKEFHRVNEIILKMPKEKREAAFKASILSSKNVCTNIKKMHFDKVKNKKAYWYVACKEDKYEVYVRDDSTGSTHVTSCSLLVFTGKECIFK